MIEEMAQVECLLLEIASLSAQGLMGAAVAISFCRRLTQPIQERVHPAFEYWGRQDPMLAFLMPDRIDILQAHRITAVAHHLRVFQGIVFFLREALW